jgi:hypothetical protein
VGDTAQRFALLREVVRTAPDDPLAHWQLGQVAVDGKWLAAEQVQRGAARDPRQAEYRQLRRRLGESPVGQLSLARWCRRNNLAAESRFHWASVLSVHPTNDEALRALDMEWHDGRPMTRNDIAATKQQAREAKRAAKRWSPLVSRWKRAVSAGDSAKQEAVLDEISAVTEAGAIPALEEITLPRDTIDEHRADAFCKVGLAFIEALSAIEDQAATESLVRHAVFSPASQVRTAAIDDLKRRPQHDYVPLLLRGLAMPIESSFQMKTDADGSVHYTHSLYREGSEGDWSFDLRRSANQHDLGGRQLTWDVATQTMEVGLPTESPVAVAAKKAVVATRYQNRYQNTAAAMEWQVAQTNASTSRLNAAIVAVLAGVTEQSFENPTEWWKWWDEKQEYYVAEDHPVERYYDTDRASFYYGYPSLAIRYPEPPPPPRGRYSCFAEGTPVWTKTGLAPIETLQLGDLVLAQDVDTGELTYKPVIGRTVRPPSPILRLELEGDALLTTRGHPFWVAGIGWRMAKELDADAILHGVSNSPRVAAIESAGEAEAYNLVIAEFSTYFVGKHGILVHDNTPRKPTRAAVPGLVVAR